MESGRSAIAGCLKAPGETTVGSVEQEFAEIEQMSLPLEQCQSPKPRRLLPDNLPFARDYPGCLVTAPGLGKQNNQGTQVTPKALSLSRSPSPVKPNGNRCW